MLGLFYFLKICHNLINNINMNPEIIKEEKDYLVINKPAGLVVHSDGRTEEKTLCDFMVDKYPEISGVGEPLKIKATENNPEKIIERPGIVHRLDRDTSGVMLVARTKEGFDFLKKLFKDRKIEKTYHSFIYGNIKEDNLVINEPIGRSKKDFRQWMSGENARGQLRPAETEFKVLKRSEDKKVTFIEAKPKTGRTHQIRVHLKSLNSPIVADQLYAPNREKLLGFERMALHAYSIRFTDQSGENLEYMAEYPLDFKKAIESFK
jgi:23S rRNA pseudouridine1911/1915/1917 synthase